MFLLSSPQTHAVIGVVNLRPDSGVSDAVAARSEADVTLIYFRVKPRAVSSSSVLFIRVISPVLVDPVRPSVSHIRTETTLDHRQVLVFRSQIEQKRYSNFILKLCRYV